MNLDDRLARDAEQWHKDDHAPSFDDALDAATRTRSTRFVPLLAAAVVTLIGLVIAALVAFPRHAAPSGEHSGGLVYRSNGPSASLVVSAPAPPVPADSTRADGTRVHYKALLDVPVRAAVIDPTKPRTLSLMLTDNGGAECSVANVRVTSLRESGDVVNVQLSGTQMSETAANGDVIVHGCTPSHFYAVDVMLDQPLGDRSVTVGDPSIHIAVLRTDELHDPAYLPAGYERRANFSSDFLQSMLMIQHTYQLKPRGKLVLIAIHLTAGGYGVEPPANGPIDVNGHGATFDADGGGCLNWLVRAGVWISVCDQGQLSDAELVRIARSLK